MEQQIQALVEKHDQTVASLEVQYKERLSEQASEYEEKLSSLAKQYRADIEAAKKVKDEGASAVATKEGREGANALRRKVTQLNETIKTMEVHMAKMVVEQQRQRQTLLLENQKNCCRRTKTWCWGGASVVMAKATVFRPRWKQKEQDHALGSKQAIDFSEGKQKKRS